MWLFPFDTFLQLLYTIFMKRKNSLYNNLLNLNNILNIYDEICRNVRNERRVIKLKEYKTSFVYEVYLDLLNKTYEVGPYNVFDIYEPKKRRIVSQGLHDKIINHLVARHILYPVIIPPLIPQNVASRPNMGTKKGYELYKKYRMSCNAKYKNYYILKCDISKFFASIDHDVLKGKLLKRIKDKDALNIVFKIIDSEATGLSIGSMTSQILAIFYLNDLDHYIKEKLKIKYYVRYQDDFLLFHPSKQYLTYCLSEIKSFLDKEHLSLNKKTRIYKNTDNFVFLGRNIQCKPVKYREIKRKLKRRYYLYRINAIDLQSLTSSLNCYSSLYPSIVNDTVFDSTFLQVRNNLSKSSFEKN